MAKKTAFRDRMRRVFSRSSSSAADSASDDRRIPSKYPAGFSKPHQDMLAAWTFVKNDSGRRASSQTMESPMGSRVHSRMHSRNPSEVGDMLKGEITIEEREGQGWDKTNRSSETASEATLRERGQNLLGMANDTVPPTSGTSGGNVNEQLKPPALNVVRA